MKSSLVALFVAGIWFGVDGVERGNRILDAIGVLCVVCAIGLLIYSHYIIERRGK